MKLLIPLATIAVSATLGSAVAVAVVKETDNSAAPTTTVVREAPGSPAASTSGSESIGDIYRSNVTGVVEIKVQTTTTTSNGPFGPQQQAAEAQGTGFEVDSKGDIVTNAHVVAGARSINVTTDDGHSYTATLVGSDPSSDVAVIHINAAASALHPLTFADSSKVQVGDEVVAIGDPFGLTDTATAGIVSALNRQITSPNNTPIMNAIQTDAAINHGNSGGPLLNADGQVVGITSQIYADSNTSGNVGIGFVVPSNTVRSVMSQLLATGKVTRPFVGVYMADVDQATAQATGLPVGAEITKVVAGSPAAHAGLKAATGQKTVQGEQFPTGGDVITKVDGSAVTSADDVISDVLQHKPGDTLSLTIVRDGHEQTVTVTLGSRS